MSEIEKATPRPWRITWCDLSHREVTRVDEIVGPDGDAIVETDGGYYDPTPADAALIVEAVNAYDALRLKLTSLEKEVREKLAALEKIVEIRNGAHPDGALGKLTDVWRVARAAIASGPCRAEALSHPTKTGTGGADAKL